MTTTKASLRATRLASSSLKSLPTSSGDVGVDDLAIAEGLGEDLADAKG
jgi:hypothetical protein